MIRKRLPVVVIAAALAPVNACGEPAPDDSGSESVEPSAHLPAGATAMWDLPRGARLDASSTRFLARVTRLGCNGGVTGEVWAPEVSYSSRAVVVTFTVVPREDDGAATCQGNALVSYQVDLDEPLGDRQLVDGQCLPGGGGASTSFCDVGGVRSGPG